MSFYMENWKDPLILDESMAPLDAETGAPLDSTASMDLGKPQMEPEVDGSPAEAPEIPSGGEI